uniref:Thiamine phosphate synthase/TenI domain-containing protein n=1 Tax=Trieres chinensis TaxID=1514140 RepID=A0A7S2A5T0_TRICV
MATAIMSLKKELEAHFVVIINDNVEAALASKVDGVHVKEHQAQDIPRIRKLLENEAKMEDGSICNRIIVGTSCHSLQSGLLNWKRFRPDYMFVGTCYLTQSHPEKTSVEQLEGPSLPGKVRQAIQNAMHKECDVQGGQEKELESFAPIILAIGGINELNCAEPVQLGADGVAVIRSVLNADDPAAVVQSMIQKMLE